MKRLTLIAIPLLLATAACGGPASEDKVETPIAESTSKPTATPTPTTPAEPQTVEGATDLAQENADRFAAQDFAGSWELFGNAAKKVIPKEEYVTYAEACDLGGGKLNIEDVRLDSNTEATVRYEYMGYTQARTLIYENGRWRGKGTNETLDYFKEGTAEAAIKAAKADGGC